MRISDLEEGVGFSATKVFENEVIYIACGNTNNLQLSNFQIALIRLELYDIEIITSDGSFVHAIKKSDFSKKDVDKFINRALRLVVKKGKLLDVFNNIYEEGYNRGQQDHAQYVSRTLTDLINIK